MKRIIFSLVCMLTFTIGISAKGSVCTNDTTFKDLRAVYIDCPAKVKIVESDTASLNILSDDTDVLNSVRYEYNDGCLRISNNICGDDINILITSPREFPVIKTGRNYEIVERKRRRQS